MSNYPLISVVLPISQLDRYAEMAFSSLKSQSYEQIEIIAVWYGDDNKKEEAAKMFFPHLACSAHSLYGAINEGLKKCKGEFITFLMPTDFYAYDRIEKCVARLLLEKGEFLFSQVHGVDEQSKTLDSGHSFWKWRQEWEFQSNLVPTIGFKLLKQMAPASLGNIIISKRIAEKIGYLKETLKIHAAYDFVLRALCYAEPIFLKEELYFYRFFRNDQKIQQDPFHQDEDEARQIRQDYLLRISAPPENKLAPCQHYWPMSFSTFRLFHNMDIGMGGKLHEVERQTAASMPAKVNAPKENLGKITLLIHDLSLSGAPRVAADLAIALKEEGYQPNVISFSDGPLRPCFDHAGIPIQFIYPRTRFWFAKQGFKKIAFIFSMASEMFRKSSHTTIAVASLTWSALFVAAFFFPFRKFIWYLHDSYAPEGIVYDGLPFRLFRKCLQRKNLRFWFGSHATREIWENAEVHGEVVYWSGIPQNSESKSKTSIKTILSVGAGYPRKGAHFLLDAFLECVKEKMIPEDVNLVIVGFPDTLQELKDFVSDLIVKVHESGVAGRIQLVKSIDEAQLGKLYESCDLYVQPSFLECLPLAMLQAMSKGIPVITTHVDGCNEAIVDGINGYTCPPRNSSILAKKIARAVQNSEEAYQLGKKGQETFNSKFSLEATKPHFFHTLAKKENEPAYTCRVSHDLNKKAKPLTELV